MSIVGIFALVFIVIGLISAFIAIFMDWAKNKPFKIIMTISLLVGDILVGIDLLTR